MPTEFNLTRHVREYHYDGLTTVQEIMSGDLADVLAARIDGLVARHAIKLVDHQGLGNDEVSDAGGRYLHHIFEGDDVRAHLPELETLYQAILPLLCALTSQDVVLSPHARSDINVKVYPPGGGTLGEHYDTNGITVLLFLSTNAEAALRVQIPRHHPASGQWSEQRKVHAAAGSLLVMKGRELLHACEPTVFERKITVVLNYYVRGDTWRHEKFDGFVYDGVDPEARGEADHETA